MLEDPSTPVPEAAAPKPSAREQSRALLERLIATYPKAFFPLSARQVHPLKLGIHKDLQPIIEGWGFDRLALRFALGLYSRHLRYHMALLKETQRVDLAGEPAGEISEEHRLRAREQADALRAKRQEKAQQAARSPTAGAAAPAEAAAPDAEAPAAAAPRPARTARRREERPTAQATENRAPRERRPARSEGDEARRSRPDRERAPRQPKAPVRASVAPAEDVESAFASALREALTKKDGER